MEDEATTGLNYTPIDKRLKKSEREKVRRGEFNEKLTELCEILNISEAAVASKVKGGKV